MTTQSRRILVDPKNVKTRAVTEDTPAVPTSDIDLDELYDKTKTILYREIRCLLEQSSAGLLNKDASQSLVNYIKLIKELRKEKRLEDEEALSGLTPDELKALANENIKETID